MEADLVTSIAKLRTVAEQSKDGVLAYLDEMRALAEAEGWEVVAVVGLQPNGSLTVGRFVTGETEATGLLMQAILHVNGAE